MANGKRGAIFILGLIGLAYFTRRSRPGPPQVPLPPVETEPLPSDATPPTAPEPEAVGLSAVLVATYTPDGGLVEQVRLEVAGGRLTYPDLRQPLRLEDGFQVVLTLELANPGPQDRTAFVQARLQDDGAIVAYFWRDEANNVSVSVPAHSLARVALGLAAKADAFGPQRRELDLWVYVDTPSVEVTLSYAGSVLFEWRPPTSS